jgi:hypothetical protein
MNAILSAIDAEEIAADAIGQVRVMYEKPLNIRLNHACPPDDLLDCGSNGYKVPHPTEPSALSS